MRSARLIICTAIYICLYNISFSQTASRISISSITSSINTGEDYSPWLNDDTTKLVADVWGTLNMQYVDVKLKLAATTNVTKLSLYDYEGVFTSTPAYIYAVSGSVKTLIATFTGPSYLVWEDVILSVPVLADTIIIHKYGNCIPEKIKIYGTAAGLVTPITGTATVCAGTNTSLSNATPGGTWASNNTAAATITAAGVATGIAAGTATISYTAAGLVATTVLTVTSANAGSINGAATLNTGSTTALTDASSGGVWSSSATGIATVSATGIVTGVAAGSSIISYRISNSCNTATATKAITVSNATVSAITGTATACIGGTTTLSDATSGGVWSSGTTTVASVSTSGKVTGIAAGTTTIKYTVGTAVATLTVTVNATPAAGSINGTATLTVGTTTTLSNATAGGVWSSSATAKATVSTAGMVTGMAAGSATISYKLTNTCGSATATKAVTVSAVTVATITGTASVCAGATTTLNDATAGGAWSSSATTIATVGATGIVTGVTAGTATIKYTVGTTAATRVITVNAQPTAGTITGTAAVTTGATATVSDAATGGAWSSSATGTATVGATGVVTGVAAGAATISYSVVNNCGTATATKAITVNAVSAGTILGATAVCAGATIPLSDATTGGTWSSLATAVATINVNGIVTGVTAGTATIKYTVGTASTTSIITVATAPAAGSVSGAASVTAGATITVSDATGAGAWSSSAAGIASVNINGVVTGIAAGTATISYSITSGGCTASATKVVTVAALPGTLVHGKIPIDGNRWYQLDNTSNGLQGLFDGDTNTQVLTGWGKILSTYDAYYPLLPGEQINIDSIRFFDGTGSTLNAFNLYYLDASWNRVLIATYTGGHYNMWVGPNTTTPTNYALPVPATNFRYLLISCTSDYPNEMELYGSYVAPTALAAAPAKTITLKQETGVNGFEWDFENPNAPDVIDETRMATIKSFGAVRHYLDWSKLEPNQGGYTFNPSHSGSWNYDTMYARCKTEGIDVLVDIKTQPDWMQATYPTGADAENVPVMYGADFTDPASYILQAKLAFQFAARYGNNANVSSSLLSVDASTRWTGDPANTVKKGLGLVTYVECDNERDKWWKGRAAYQTGREYAANMSAFYDGNKNTMGPGVGVKNADPTMQVVMAGVASPVPDYFLGMIDWCKEYRGYNADGSVNLCWDVINYHVYPDNGGSLQGSGTQGAAPEVAHMDTIAKQFITAAHTFARDMPVWVTETGYDLNQGSPLKAIAIGSKTAAQTEADWILRNSLLYARMGVERTFFYMIDDQDTTSAVQFSSSGLIINNSTRRPAADFLYQANKLMGNYVYTETISTNPLIDRYELNGNSAYVLVKPSQDGSTVPYTMHLSSPGNVHIYNPAIGQDSMNVTVGIPSGSSNALALTVTETPMFIIPSAGTTGARTSAPGAEVNNTATASQAVVSIFPNPTTGSISLSIDNDSAGDVSVTIYSETGRVCLTHAFTKTAGTITETMDLGTLPNGLYNVEIIEGSDRQIKKVIKVNR